jgi:hypothetical protein
VGCGGCGHAARYEQAVKTNGAEPPRTLPDGAVRFPSPVNASGVDGFEQDPVDLTVLRPMHKPCKHRLTQALLKQDGSAGVLCMCLGPGSLRQGQGCSVADCSSCDVREP